jgi:hypothetical protein
MLLRPSQPLSAKATNDERLALCVAKYKGIRQQTRELLEEQIFNQTRRKIDVCPVGERVFDAIDAQWQPVGRKVCFPWREDIHKILRQTHPRRLELSLWNGTDLCGVGVARLSDARKWVSVTYIEGSPIRSHPLKGQVVTWVLIAADIFAALVAEACSIHKPRIRILHPLPESIEWYEQLGYYPVQHARANGKPYTYIVVTP